MKESGDFELCLNNVFSVHVLRGRKFPDGAGTYEDQELKPKKPLKGNPPDDCQLIITMKKPKAKFLLTPAEGVGNFDKKWKCELFGDVLRLEDITFRPCSNGTVTISEGGSGPDKWVKAEFSEGPPDWEIIFTVPPSSGPIRIRQKTNVTIGGG